MSLSLYKKKRSFDDTPEPTGGRSSLKDKLVFVVQKHDATRLHYDFRLEIEGVLKSWAVPKGPSLDPSVKRLAMMVEDHPFDYRNFEGIIPEGNYGAGTVIVWDEGTYEPLENASNNKKENEKNLLKQLYAGSLKFVMHGKKLKGEFALVKTTYRGENSWLLIKHNDKYASTEDITEKDKSVVSKKTIAQVEETTGRIWKSNRGEKSKVKSKNSKAESSSAKKNDSQKSYVDEVTELLQKAKRAAFPSHIKPMLATLTDEPFDDPGWVYEIKWDGYRAVSYLNKGEVEILSRNNLSFTQKFKEVTDALKHWHINAVIDGEIIAINNEGVVNFQQLQNFANKGEDVHLEYYVFDILWLDGKDLTSLTLLERKGILETIMPEDDSVVRFSDHIEEKGKELFELATQRGLEGIMAKKSDSTYMTNFRTKLWLKIKNNKRLEAIICGFTEGRKSRKHFGALVLGKYEGDKLIYIGHTGTGFNDKTLNEVEKKLAPLVTDKMPFAQKPKTNMPVTWVNPKLVCEIKFSQITDEGILRHPVFMGLRADKEAKNEKNVEVVQAGEREKSEVRGEKSEVRRETSKKKANGSRKNSREKTRNSKLKTLNSKQLLPTTSKEETVNINGHDLKFTNLDKLYWPDEKITKRDMLNYYYNIMPYILPYMKDRPQSLNRFPDGIKGKSFYQKNVEGKVADWLTTYHYKSESSGDKEFLVCADEASLLYTASLGCIEMNPWHSRTQRPENPDWCVIDLDPDDKNTFEQVIDVAQAVRKVLDAIDVPGYPKTSGSTGMHIYIPLGAQYTYEQSKLLAELIVNVVHPEVAAFTSLERSPAKRKGKIYLDFLQNRTIQTIAAPYSLRPKPGATVSTPLDWSEVKKGLTIKQFNINTIFDRVKDAGDIFKPVLEKGIDLKKTLEEINDLR
jgi:bifunctional non-homologous end joining protein LigD